MLAPPMRVSAGLLPNMMTRSDFSASDMDEAYTLS